MNLLGSGFQVPGSRFRVQVLGAEFMSEQLDMNPEPEPEPGNQEPGTRNR
jgi:hypothetical protein